MHSRRWKSFYMRLSGPYLSVVAMFVATFVRLVFVFKHSAAAAQGNAIVIIVVLPLILVALLLHRTRIRHLIINRAADEDLLFEMTSILVSLTVAICMFAILTVR